MVAALTIAVGAVAALTSCASAAAALLTDINAISQNWGELSPYSDNAESYFGVTNIGLPDGCQVEQVHTLQRHAQRFPTGGYDEGTNDENFAARVKAFSKKNPTAKFTGPLAFLSNYTYLMSESLLTGIGAETEFTAGVTFWNRYGRILFDAGLGQLAYNMSDGASPKPFLRTTSESRIYNSAINWALGFFGYSFQEVPNPTLAGSTTPYDLEVIVEGGTGTENNTLASYDSCLNSDGNVIGYLGDLDLEMYLPLYLKDATARMQQYAPAGFKFTINDTFAMQSICAYETAYIGQSDFCLLFTAEEWAGFEYTTDLQYYYDYSYGNPTGRAQGIGYVQELIARLTHHLIPVSDSSVNSTLDGHRATFRLHEPFFADFSHDDIIVSTLTALSLDYFYSNLSVTAYPPDPTRGFRLSKMTPFGARLVTEVIGCAAADPPETATVHTFYTPDQYGYDAADAPNKFVRMRLNYGILPLTTIRGGFCTRTDGLCALDAFLDSQKNAAELANYQYACFGKYTVTNHPPGKDYDGTIFKKGT